MPMKRRPSAVFQWLNTRQIFVAEQGWDAYQLFIGFERREAKLAQPLDCMAVAAVIQEDRQQIRCKGDGLFCGYQPGHITVRLGRVVIIGRVVVVPRVVVARGVRVSHDIAVPTITAAAVGAAHCRDQEEEHDRRKDKATDGSIAIRTLVVLEHA